MSEISVIITSRGNLSHLKKCLQSLVNLGKKPLDIFIVSEKKINPDFGINDLKFFSDDNLGLTELKNKVVKEVKGDWLLFLDEKCSLHFKYAEHLISLFTHNKIDLLAGPMLPTKDQSLNDYAKAVACSSPLCTGVSFARYRSLGTQLVITDDDKIPAEHFWIRANVLKDQLFLDNLSLSPEIHFIQDQKNKGAGIFYHPKLIVWTFHDLKLRDFFQKGYLRSKLIRKKLKSGQEIYWLPPLFVGSHFFILIEREFFSQLFLMYFALVGAVSLGLSIKSKKVWIAPLVVMYHYLIVLFYGFGLIKERLKFK